MDDYGNLLFNTKYSQLGELVRRCKYRKDRTAIPEIAREVVAQFPAIYYYSILVPVPRSDPALAFHPVVEIAHTIAALACMKVRNDFFDVRKHTELKSISDPTERVARLRENVSLAKDPPIEGERVLIFDDLYRSGATLTVLCDLLRPFRPASLGVLTVTKTRAKK